MLLQLMLRDEYRNGRAEGFADGKVAGFADGKAIGKAESILLVLEDLGFVSDDLRSFILEQNNTDTLKDMIRKASRAESVEQFMESISFKSHP